VRPIPMRCRRHCLRPDLTASKTNAIPESALTSTCTPTAHTVSGVKKLPLNLLDAIRALEDSALMAESLGALVPAYLKLKKHEWNEYARHLTDWERETTLDC
jgi:glutamate---methylamine ligase